jgi:tetratricopeptide (TPR) repeat protein
MQRRLPIAYLLAAALVGLGPAALAANPQQLMRLLETRRCSGCKLQDADLVHADLRDANLSRAQLQRANLSGARLDGAKLQGADLSFTSLAGASLRGADLRGALLEGTDVREADLSGALLDPKALARAHWEKAIGIQLSAQSYAELHNAGVESANKGRFPEAERHFGDAIRKQPNAGISWVARGISRTEQGKTTEASQDFAYAASLYEQAGDQEKALQLRQASQKLLEPTKKKDSGNGFASQLFGGVIGLAQFLAPIAAKGLMAF